MKRLLLLCGVLFIHLQLWSQVNLVPNPSFEEYDSIAVYDLDSIFYSWEFYPKYWYNPVPCWTHIYYNSTLCNIDTTTGNVNPYGVPHNPWSYTYPKEGNAYAEFSPFTISPDSTIEGMRNYIEIELNQELVSEHKYCLSFFVTLSDCSYVAIDQIGAYFSNSQLYIPPPSSTAWVPNYFYVTPQMVSPPGYFFNYRKHWQQISGSFYANGGEKFMTIGNFKLDGNTNYIYVPDSSSYYGTGYFIDMVTLVECDSIINGINAGKDTTICLGDSIKIGPSGFFPGYDFHWSPGIGLSDSCINDPFAKPLQTTTYILYQTYYGSTAPSDTVIVTVQVCNPTVNETSDNGSRLSIYPNPTTCILYFDGLTNDASAEIYDISGKLLITKQLITNQIDISSLAKGLYFIKLSTEEGSVVRKFVKE